MSRTQLLAVGIAPPYALHATQMTLGTPADTSNGNAFQVTGSEILVVTNTDTVNPHHITISSTPDFETSRTGDITSDSIPKSTSKIYGRFPLNGWRQSDGNVYLLADSASLSIAIIRLPEGLGGTIVAYQGVTVYQSNGALALDKGTPTLYNVTANGTAALLLAANTSRKSAIIVNNDAVNVLYIGPANTVTTTAGSNDGGIPIQPGGNYEDLTGNSAWYGITTGASIDVRIMEIA